MHDWDRIAASKNVGALLTIVSAVLFGVTPALGKMTYAEGSNGTKLLFFRSAMALPILFFWLKEVPFLSSLLIVSLMNSC